jgi:hypothetical protein
MKKDAEERRRIKGEKRGNGWSNEIQMNAFLVRPKRRETDSVVPLFSALQNDLLVIFHLRKFTTRTPERNYRGFCTGRLLIPWHAFTAVANLTSDSPDCRWIQGQPTPRPPAFLFLLSCKMIVCPGIYLIIVYKRSTTIQSIWQLLLFVDVGDCRSDIAILHPFLGSASDVMRYRSGYGAPAAGVCR